MLVGTIVVVLAVSELGFYFGRRRARRPEFESEAQVSSLTGAHLGLLAFILAFSFSVAADQSTKRKALILEEALAIEDAYLKAGLLEPAQTAAIRDDVRRYTRLRSTVGEMEDIPLFVAQSEEILRHMWQQVGSLGDDGRFDELDRMIAESVSLMISLHERRVAAGLRMRVPVILWVTLYLLLLLSMMGMGYFSGIKGKHSPLANTALCVSFSMVLFLIADLDRPREGIVKPDQSLMKDLSRRMENAFER
jgi:hypothetical protein